MTPPFLSGKNISVALGGNPILRDVTMHLSKGELLGLIGPNGSGKSTLLRSLMGMQRGARGDVRVEDIPLSKQDIKERARKIAYMPQGATCHWPLSVQRVVSLGRLPHGSSWAARSPADARAIEQAMVDARVGHLSHRIFPTLSYGERVRSLLGRALAVQAPALLADEPVAGLDPGHQIQLMHLLRRLARQGQAVLVVLHELTLAARYCDRLLLLNKGQALSSGTPQEVLTADNLMRAYGLRAHAETRNGEFFVVPWDCEKTKEEVAP